MATITSLNASNVKSLSEEIDAALSQIATRHGLVIKTAGGKFTPSNAMLKLSIATVSKDGEVMSEDAADLRRAMGFLGLTEADLETVYTDFHGRKMKIVGYRRKAHKNPMIVQDQDNQKRYIAGLTEVKAHLAHHARAKATAKPALAICQNTGASLAPRFNPTSSNN